jgi:hypothetical protein
VKVTFSKERLPQRSPLLHERDTSMRVFIRAAFSWKSLGLGI